MTDFLFFLKNQNKSTFLFLLLFTATMLSGKEFPEVVVPRFEKAPQLDGKLDDEIWQKTREYRFRNVLRNKKSPESFVRFGYDGNYLYFGMRFLEPEMAKRRVTRHDPTKEDIPADDNLDLQIIPCNANVYQLIGNSAGALYCNVDGAPWVSGAKCAFLEGEDFWSAEIAIPFSSLGWTPRGGERWKISVGRQRVIGGEKTWSTLADLSPLNFLTNAFPICFEGNPEQRLAVECQEKTVRVSIASRNAGKIAVTAFGSNRSRMKKIVPFAGGTGAEILTEFSFPFVVRSLNLELKDAAGSRYASEISLIRKEQSGPRVMTVENPLFSELPRLPGKPEYPGLIHWYHCFTGAELHYKTALQFGLELVQEKRLAYAEKNQLSLFVPFRDTRLHLASRYRGMRISIPFWKWFSSKAVMYRGWALPYAESEKQILANLETMVRDAKKTNLRYVCFGDEMAYWSMQATVMLHKEKRETYPFIRKVDAEVRTRFGGGRWGIPESMEDPHPGRWIAFNRCHSEKIAALHRREYERVKQIDPSVGFITEDAHITGSRTLDYAQMRGAFDVATLQPTMIWGGLDTLAMIGFDIKKQKDLSDAADIRPCVHFEHFIENFTLDEVISLFSQAVQAGATGWHFYLSDTRGLRSGRNFLICEHYGAPERIATAMKIAEMTPHLRYPEADCAFFTSQDTNFTVMQWQNRNRFCDYEIPAYTILGPKAGIWFRFENVTSAAAGGLDRYRMVFVVDAPYEREESLSILKEYAERGGTLVLFDPKAFERDNLTDLRSGLEKFYGVTVGEKASRPKALLSGRKKYLFPAAPYTVKPLPGTSVLARFDDGTPAITSRAHGKGKIIHFSVNPFERNIRQYAETVDFMRDFFSGYGVAVRRDIWRFRFPDSVKVQPVVPPGKCLTGNHILWSRFTPSFQCNQAASGSYSWSRTPDLTGDSGSGKIAFSSGKLTNRRSALNAGNVEFNIGRLEDYVVSFRTDAPMTLAIDLGAVYDTDRLELFFMHSLPAIEMRCSADGKEWRTQRFEPVVSDNYDVYREIFPVPGQTRFINISFTASKMKTPDLVIGEMEIWSR